MQNINLALVFLEGVLSFLSPCILPILPVYLSILSNSQAESLQNDKEIFIKTSLFRNTICFTLGISTTFFILGTSVSLLSKFLVSNKDFISFIGGILIILMGLFYVDLLKLSFLNREKRFHMPIKRMNMGTAYLLGFTFSFGWTPCIGPMLASVLLMVSGSDSIVSGNLLIVIYTIGFIVPFLLLALFYNKVLHRLDQIKSHMNLIKKIGGMILIISGFTMLMSGWDGVRASLYGINKAPIETQDNGSSNDELGEESNEAQEKVEKDNRIKSIDFTLYDQYGNEHTLSDYKGKTVFLNFWAIWCPPCRREMPHIEEIYKEYGTNQEDVIILGVAAPKLGEEVSKEEIITFLEENAYTFPVVFDEEWTTFFQYGIRSFPSTFIIDPEGYVTQYVPGAMDKETMKYLIELE